jgi:3-hexulose-6-phosphate synthase/6-phospho-3-hexuloisomerase
VRRFATEKERSMKLTLHIARPPVIQIALDYATIDEALAMAQIGIRAGVDWLEVGTPLIVAQGVAAIGQLARAFADYPVLADYKTMDSGGKNVERTAAQGGHVMTVCANAPDETVKSAVAESRKSGVWVVADTIGVKDQPARAGQCAEWGVHMIYLHYGADQRRHDAGQDSTQWLAAVQRAVDIPIGVGCFEVADGVRAAQMGAELIAIGHPVISAADPLAELSRFVREVKSAYRPRPA